MMKTNDLEVVIRGYLNDVGLIDMLEDLGVSDYDVIETLYSSGIISDDDLARVLELYEDDE